MKRLDALKSLDALRSLGGGCSTARDPEPYSSLPGVLNGAGEQIFGRARGARRAARAAR
jgi:hypothetical protein